MFTIYILPSNHCFQSTNFVSNLNSLFPLYFFCFLSHNHVYHQSTYYRNKYFWNVKNGFWIIQVCIFISFNSELFFKKVIYGLSEIFFLDFSNSVPAQKILITTRFFCLIMLHLIVNCKNHHSEVCHLSKKIIKWVFLFKNCYRNQCKHLVGVAIFIPKSTRRTHIFGKKIWAGRPDF